MVKISSPYVITYPWITALTESGDTIELIECFDCVGGAMWVKKHYAQSPLVRSVRTIGSTNRYILDAGTVDLSLEGSRFPAGISGAIVTTDQIHISYKGMGGGGVGATICRAKAEGVIGSRYDESGGGKVAASTLMFPRMQRLLIGVDDTDTPEEGATWTLMHNLSQAVADEKSRYLSHTIVQLFPVPFKTKNCVGVVVEFATTEPEVLADRFCELVKEYTLSNHTGMVSFTGFSPDDLLPYAWRVKKGLVSPDEARQIISKDKRLKLYLDGRGITGALAAVPFYTRYEEALELCGPV